VLEFGHPPVAQRHRETDCSAVREGGLNSVEWVGDTLRPGVETVQLHDGVSLVLSSIELGEECAFHHVEFEDVFAIGFHLKGGAQFDMDGKRFETLPLEVHAGAAPRTSASTFILPAHGFRTVSLRFAPDVARDLLHRHGLGDTGMAAMVERAQDTASAMRLGSLDPTGISMIESMFASPIRGAGRTLFLESCALGLLAALVDSCATSAGVTGLQPLERGLREARAYLDAHLGSPPSILQLARIAGINDFKLKRSFKAAFGTTIHGYVRQRRMEQAATDLYAGLSVAAAAAKVGYECPRCFADAFRRQFGVLPSEVTRSVVGKTPAHHGR
jgi:AraC-like DNA-binding protein